MFSKRLVKTPPRRRSTATYLEMCASGANVILARLAYSALTASARSGTPLRRESKRRFHAHIRRVAQEKNFCAALLFRQAKNRRFAETHITKKALRTGNHRVCFRFVSCVTQGKIVTVMRKNETCSFGLIMALQTRRRIAI